MANINLLPWREYKREHEKKAFIRLLSLAAIVGFCLSFLFYYYTSRLVVAQNMRNEKLNQQIVTLDKKIKEISSIRQRKNRLVARMKAIQILQAKRTLTIHLFDELLNVLPDGVYLTEFKREKEKITLTGYTESNSDISLLMRNIQNDPWIENPDLTEIKKNNQVNNAVNNEFHLSFVLQGTKPEKVAPK
ncbi:MAG: pilus assembly protein PilN [Legionellaceae bacterium]|nr:pilus assembly protein PilN [Legionellaceae bacterium]HCA90066.1 pilus assembly protein PilN [Legionellales bacterium]|tara:strand:+ start:115 stop:684 length:570 start_codon:yes stop_codon:yes gene_type:complete